jgi:hypothetical protein
MIMSPEAMNEAGSQNHASYVRDAQVARQMNLVRPACNEDARAVGFFAASACRILGVIAHGLLSAERAVVHLRRRIAHLDSHIPSHHVQGIIRH